MKKSGIDDLNIKIGILISINEIMPKYWPIITEGALYWGWAKNIIKRNKSSILVAINTAIATEIIIKMSMMNSLKIKIHIEKI